LVRGRGSEIKRGGFAPSWTPRKTVSLWVILRETSPLFDSPLVSLSLKGERRNLETVEAPLLPVLTKRASHYNYKGV